MPTALEAKSDACWTLGIQLLDQGEADAAANRIYYAVLQMVCAAMQRDPGHHAAQGGRINHQTALEYVGLNRPGRREYHGKQFQKLFKLRLKADYSPEPVLGSDLRALLCIAGEIRDYHREKLKRSGKAPQ